MIVTILKATTKRCCGPEGCGHRVSLSDKERGDPRDYGARYCHGPECMAWVTLARGVLVDPATQEPEPDPTMDGHYQTTDLGTCGHAPELPT